MLVFAGPCSLESESVHDEIAAELNEIRAQLPVELVFKASFDKANRLSGQSYRSWGIDDGLAEIDRISRNFSLPSLTDVHEVWQVERANAVVDFLQIPALLCRQTDLLKAAGATKKPINIKKGQFSSPGDMALAAEKVREAGGLPLLCERGTFFGYGDLVVDFRNIVVMKDFAPVVFDATHSVQRPGKLGLASGGDRKMVAPLARAAAAIGVTGFFFETHPRPDEALSDGPNMVPLQLLGDLLEEIVELNDLGRMRRS